MRISYTPFMATKRVKKNKAAVALGRKGGKANAEKMTPEERSKAAAHAAKERWKKEKGESSPDELKRS